MQTNEIDCDNYSSCKPCKHKNPHFWHIFLYMWLYLLLRVFLHSGISSRYSQFSDQFLCSFYLFVLQTREVSQTSRSRTQRRVYIPGTYEIIRVSNQKILISAKFGEGYSFEDCLFQKILLWALILAKRGKPVGLKSWLDICVVAECRAGWCKRKPYMPWH